MNIETNNNNTSDLPKHVVGEHGHDATQNDWKATSHKTPSERKVIANRRNAERSTGPRNTDRTKSNALKHGLFAVGLTAMDDPEEYASIIRDLEERFPGRHPMKDHLIARVALEMIRSSRNARIEAEGIELVSANDKTSDRPMQSVDPVLMQAYGGQQLERLQRYETAGLNRLLRCLRQLERMQEKQQTGGVIVLDPSGNSTV
ncbi:MAG TPA: hypothetical protein VF133_12025 [Terriglobales bacterium]